jgi:hypothetical protein
VNDPGEWLPILGVALLALTTVASIAGAWAVGRARGLQDAAQLQRDEADTRARIERMERNLDAVAEEIERLGEVQRFALKVIAEKAIDATEPAPRLQHGRVITPH